MMAVCLISHSRPLSFLSDGGGGGVDGTPLAAIARSGVVFSFQDTVSDAVLDNVLSVICCRRFSSFLVVVTH